MGKFHYKDGWYFERLVDGSVRIIKNIGSLPSATSVTIDPASWASIVAHVSLDGDTADTFAKAVVFHQGGAKE